MERNYQAEHTHRQQFKHRIAFEIDRQVWERLTKEKQSELKKQLQQHITDFLKTD